MNKVVDFSIAKLLKEKGFDEQNLTIYQDGEVLLLRSTISNSQFMTSRNYTAPTIAEVIDWLYEKYSIWIVVDWMNRINPYNSGFICHLRGTNKRLNSDNFVVINNTKEPGYEVFNSPTEAYEAAIKYCLTNLI